MSDPTPHDTTHEPGAASGSETDEQPAMALVQAPVPEPGSHPVLRYTLARLGILVAVAAVLYLVGARGLLLLVFAFLISGLISMVALNRTREGAAYGITSAIRSANAKIDASSRAEDDALDAAAASAPRPTRPTEPTEPAEPSPASEPQAPVDEWDDPAPR